MEAGTSRALRPSARALDRTAAGAVPVDHAHGPGGRGRVLDLHLRAATRGRRCRSRSAARTHRVPLRRDRDRAAREAASERRRPLHLRRPLARAVGRAARRLALRRVPAARRAVPLSRVRLGDARRLQHERRLALQRPVVDLGAVMAAIVFLLTYRDVRISTGRRRASSARSRSPCSPRWRSGSSSRRAAI